MINKIGSEIRGRCLKKQGFSSHFYNSLNDPQKKVHANNIVSSRMFFPKKDCPQKNPRGRSLN